MPAAKAGRPSQQSRTDSALSWSMSRSLRFALAARLLALLMGTAPRADDMPPPLSVRITSPLGRMGAHTNVRLVAQIHVAPKTVLEPVRFYVDGALFGTDEDGPPYAVEWIDENPFETRELAVEVEDSRGHTARDSVRLEAVRDCRGGGSTSVLLEASVYDQRGRFVNRLDASSFAVQEDGVPQAVDVVSHEALPAIFALLIDSSHSMHRRIDFVRDGVEALHRLSEARRPRRWWRRSRGLERCHGTDRRSEDGARGRRARRSSGGTAILDSLVEVVQKAPAGLGRRAVVLITDGYDEDSVTSIDEALGAVKAAQVTVYVVGIGGVAGMSLKGERLLRRIASETGGQTFFSAAGR